MWSWPAATTSGSTRASGCSPPRSRPASLCSSPGSTRIGRSVRRPAALPPATSNRSRSPRPPRHNAYARVRRRRNPFVMTIDQRDLPRNGPSAPGRGPTGGTDLSASMRTRLIVSRLTPNAISMVGLIGNLTAAVLIWQGLYFLGGVAFIVGSVMDTLDGRYARASGKGTLFGAFLDSTLDRIEEG